MKQPAICMMTNKKHGAIYTGVTSNLVKRVYEHKQEISGGFTARYNCKILFYFEVFDEMVCAITREKQIKGGSRKSKINLIERINPEWKDLYLQII